MFELDSDLGFINGREIPESPNKFQLFMCYHSFNDIKTLEHQGAKGSWN